MKLLLTDSGVSNASILAALVDLLGRPITEARALCIPTAGYGGLYGDPDGPWNFISGQADGPMTELGWKSVGVLELTALPSIERRGGVLSRVGVPQYEQAPIGEGSLFRHNLHLAGGPAPVRAYIGELLPDILDGTIEPGKVFDLTTGLDNVADGYRDMADRSALKVLLKP